MLDIQKVKKYGREVWCNGPTDDLRKAECLCLNCGVLKQCPVAAQLFDLCKRQGLAMLMTRCPMWQAKEDEG
jgi:hypothetical protein